MRIMCLDGPGDAIGSFEHWERGEDIGNVTHVPFSRQLFDVCHELDAKLWLIGEHPRIDRVERGNFIIEHRGRASRGKAGGAYHLSELNHARKIMADVLRFRADLVIMSPRPSPLLMSMLRAVRVRFVMVLYCVLWRKFAPPRGVRRALSRFNAPMYRWGAEAVLCISEEVKRQVRELAGPSSGPFVDFLPQFREEVFAGIAKPQAAVRPFRVMFAGRIERNKGVFDLVEVAKRLRQRGRDDIVFDICGDGGAFEQLKAHVRQFQLEEMFALHGWCDRSQMRACFSRSHVVVVPTTTDFIEGFNMVVVEALLAGRPVISSPVCPALEYLDGAVVTVPPDDIAAYEAAIVGLADDAERYNELQHRSERAGRRFLDERTSLKAALEHTLGAIARGERVVAKEIAGLDAVNGRVQAQAEDVRGEVLHSEPLARG